MKQVNRILAELMLLLPVRNKHGGEVTMIKTENKLCHIQFTQPINMSNLIISKKLANYS